MFSRCQLTDLLESAIVNLVCDLTHAIAGSARAQKELWFVLVLYQCESLDC